MRAKIEKTIKPPSMMIRCPGNCGSTLTINSLTFEKYFEIKKDLCEICSHLSFYELLKLILEENFMNNAAYAKLVHRIIILN